MRQPFSLHRNPLAICAALACPTLPIFASADDSVFFIDTPTLIETSAAAIYRELENIEDGELVANESPVSVNCKAQRKITSPATGIPCPPNPAIVETPCIARIKFALRSSFKSDVTALNNGQCEIHFRYRFIVAQQLENGKLLIDGNLGTGSGNKSGDCENIKPYLEVTEAIELHQAALDREINFLETQVKVAP